MPAPTPDPTSGPTSTATPKGSSGSGASGSDATPTTATDTSEGASATDSGQQSAASAPASTRGAARDKGPACPTCGGTLDKYLGEAAHKLGSFWCRACGVRHRPAQSPGEQVPSQS